ncbi:MAG: TonB-dependent receptor [Comamonadaceae bacterium]
MKNPLSRARLLVFVLQLSAVSSVLAQTPSKTFQLDETVVTANRSEQLLTEALPHTTVIGRDVIERSQAVDLPTLLSSEAGFQFTQNGGRGMSATLFLRGSASLQVLVLIDGVPLTKQDSTGSVSLEHIMLDQVERVEVVRGNVSAIYGSGAVGGVIQVFMRKGQGKPKAFAQLEVGSFGSARASAGVSGQVGETSYFVGFGRYRTTGFSAMNTSQYPNENPDSDGYRNTNYNLGLSQLLLPGHSLGLRAEGSDGEFDTDGGGFGTPTAVYKGASKLGTWSLYSHNQMTRDWLSKLTFSQERERSVYDARLTAFPYDSEAVTRSRTLNWTHSVVLGPWLLTAGAESQRQFIDATDSLATQLNRERGVSALFAGLSGILAAHSMQFNLRRDNADGQPGETTGYLGYGFQLAPAWKLIASLSSAFNLPPLAYLYDPFSGNPTLKPETAHSTELGLQWAQDKQVVRTTIFKTRTSNLMQYDFATWTFNNVTDATNRGLELSYSGKLASADLRASLTLQDPLDESTGMRLIRRARNMASFGASLPLGQWTWGADLRYTGARPDIVTVPHLPAYTVINLTTRFALSQEVALTAHIDNLLDRQYQTAYGYNQSGRAAYVGIVWAQK